MNVKLLAYHPQPYGEYQIGYCTVNLSDKCDYILKVLRSKTGHVYCTFATLKIGEEWVPSFSFKDKDYERAFLDDCLSKVKPQIERLKYPQA